MTTLTITGNICAQELSGILRNYYADRNVWIDSSSSAAQSLSTYTDSGQVNDLIIGILPNNNDDNDGNYRNDGNNNNNSSSAAIAELHDTLTWKNKEIQELEKTTAKALESVQTFQRQHQALYDRFVSLRQIFDEQKLSLLNTLWIHCGAYHPDLREIPVLEDMGKFIETEDRVGEFMVGETLGQGQFATVRSCCRDGSELELAVKIIKKDRFTTFTALKRISNEIKILRRLRSDFIVSVKDVVQTMDNLYIVTEKGGCDLFESFDDTPDGVPESWAKEIIICVLKAVLYCHDQGICHRDLKPENILLTFDKERGKCVDLKLCDFGLSTKFNSMSILTDFCGSPGFFAPEMIITGQYDGDKVDVWSTGCVLLELLFGHRRFIDVWMVAYDYEVLQSKDLFTEEIKDTVNKLPSALSFSTELNDFIMQFLILNPKDRPKTRTICMHPWLCGAFDTLLNFGPKQLSQPLLSTQGTMSFSNISHNSNNMGNSNNINNMGMNNHGMNNNNNNNNNNKSSNSGNMNMNNMIRDIQNHLLNSNNSSNNNINNNNNNNPPLLNKNGQLSSHNSTRSGLTTNSTNSRLGSIGNGYMHPVISNTSSSDGQCNESHRSQPGTPQERADNNNNSNNNNTHSPPSLSSKSPFKPMTSFKSHLENENSNGPKLPRLNVGSPRECYENNGLMHMSGRGEGRGDNMSGRGDHTQRDTGRDSGRDSNNNNNNNDRDGNNRDGRDGSNTGRIERISERESERGSERTSERSESGSNRYQGDKVSERISEKISEKINERSMDRNNDRNDRGERGGGGGNERNNDGSQIRSQLSGRSDGNDRGTGDRGGGIGSGGGGIGIGGKPRDKSPVLSPRAILASQSQALLHYKGFSGLDSKEKVLLENYIRSRTGSFIASHAATRRSSIGDIVANIDMSPWQRNTNGSGVSATSQQSAQTVHSYTSHTNSHSNNNSNNNTERAHNPITGEISSTSHEHYNHNPHNPHLPPIIVESNDFDPKLQQYSTQQEEANTFLTVGSSSTNTVIGTSPPCDLVLKSSLLALQLESAFSEYDWSHPRYDRGERGLDVERGGMSDRWERGDRSDRGSDRGERGERGDRGGRDNNNDGSGTDRNDHNDRDMNDRNNRNERDRNSSTSPYTLPNRRGSSSGQGGGQGGGGGGGGVSFYGYGNRNYSAPRGSFVTEGGPRGSFANDYHRDRGSMNDDDRSDRSERNDRNDRDRNERERMERGERGDRGGINERGERIDRERGGRSERDRPMRHTSFAVDQTTSRGSFAIDNDSKSNQHNINMINMQNNLNNMIMNNSNNLNNINSPNTMNNMTGIQNQTLSSQTNRGSFGINNSNINNNNNVGSNVVSEKICTKSNIVNTSNKGGTRTSPSKNHP